MAVVITDTGVQDSYLDYDDLVVDQEFAVFGTNFEVALRSKFPTLPMWSRKAETPGVVRRWTQGTGTLAGSVVLASTAVVDVSSNLSRPL